MFMSATTGQLGPGRCFQLSSMLRMSGTTGQLAWCSCQLLVRHPGRHHQCRHQHHPKCPIVPFPLCVTNFNLIATRSNCWAIIFSGQKLFFQFKKKIKCPWPWLGYSTWYQAYDPGHTVSSARRPPVIGVRVTITVVSVSIMMMKQTNERTNKQTNK